MPFDGNGSGFSGSNGAGTMVKRRFCLTLLGVFLVQLVWILVVPPFGGMDEHEHAYKAAAVARGDWSTAHRATAWGEFVRVPRSLVEAARPECDLLKYVTRHSCVPGSTGPDGLVDVASSAARYNPAYYAVVGPMTLVLGGYHALYAMRFVSALVCALFIAAAMAVSPVRTLWPAVAVLLGLTPTALYSTAIVAPNGLEICSAALLWASLLALTRPDSSPARQARLLALATLASVPLIVVRTLGPLWWLLIVGVCAAYGWERIRVVARGRTVWIGAVVVALAGAYALTWDLAARTNAVPSATAHVSASDWRAVPWQFLSWFFQTVAAMPFRDQLVPLAVYAVFFAIAGMTIAVGIARANRRERSLLAAVFLFASSIGLGVTIVALPHSGFVWQGRYFMPLTIGFFFLVCQILDRTSTGRLASSRSLAVVAAGMLMITHMISALHVLRLKSQDPLVETGHWLEPDSWVVVVLTGGGAALILAGMLIGRRSAAARTLKEVDGDLMAAAHA